MAEESRRSALGILKRDTVGVEANVERALAILGKLGLSEPGPELRNALSIALMHSSYLHEHQAAHSRITKGLLDALSVLGLHFLRRLATVDAYERAATPTAGSLSKDVAQVASALPSWAARQAWLLECAAIGRTFADATPPAKVSAHLCRRVIGVLCLANEETAASRLLEDLLAEVRRQRSTTPGDPKTILQKAIAPGPAEYAYERVGPDHKTMFRATATDSRGRRGTGEGRSKKLAAQSAALDFLQRHIPQALSVSEPERASPLVPVAIPEPPAHVQAVQQLQNLFALPASARPLLTQALIHASWAYEHRSSMIKYHQRDNEVLAFIGAEASAYEDVLAATRQATTNPPQEFAFRLLDNRGYNSVFCRTGLAAGLLLGTGQASLGTTAEIGATAFQAVVGAVFAARNFPDSLAPSWPKAWALLWQVIAPTMPRSADPTTLLQEVVSAMRLQTEYEFSCSGPQHQRAFQATLILSSEALGSRTRVIGSPVGDKTWAKHEASAAVLRALDRLARPMPARALADAPPGEARLARFLLAHQADIVAKSAVPLQRWAAARLFGLHLAGSPTELIAWADGADRILDSRSAAKAAGPRLEEAFRAALEGALQPADALGTRLSRTLQALEQISAPEDLRREHLDNLAQLCGLFRCVGADDPDTNLTALVNDWQLLYPGQLATPPVPDVALTGRERAILDVAMAAILLPGATATVEVTSAGPLRVQILTTAGPAPLSNSIAEICTLWSGASSTAQLSPVEGGIEVIITTTKTPAEPGPITAAALAASRPRREPYQASIADLLHDLKNQAAAACQAIAQPVETETARLEQQLDARRHLEGAHAIILGLRAATSLLEPAGDENASAELGACLRRYCRGVFAWLPENIELSTPGASHSAHVAIGDRTLTFILDNLVKNAVEALQHGGSIKLNWVADQYQAIIEVADDGPGLPAGMAQALVSGERIHSTKPGGNGLGLLSAKRLLSQVGGQLATAPASSGTAWEITLPIAATTASEDA